MAEFPLFKQKPFGLSEITSRTSGLVDFEYPSKDDVELERVDGIDLSPYTIYFSSMMIHMKNGNSIGGCGGAISNRKKIEIKGLCNKKISTVSFFFKRITRGLQYFSGISIHDREGKVIARDGDFRKGEWCEYILEEDEYIFGLYG